MSLLMRKCVTQVLLDELQIYSFNNVITIRGVTLYLLYFIKIKIFFVFILYYKEK